MDFHVRSSRHGEQDDRHGGKLHWVDTGPPVLLGDSAQMPLLRAAELDQLPLVCFAKSGVFDLSNSDDKEYYNWVRDHAAAGNFTITLAKHYWNDATNTMRVYMEWVQRYRFIPDRAVDRHGRQNHDQFVLD